MALKTINDEHLVAIGNAIREKNRTTTQYKPSEMGAAIRTLSTGGGDIDVEDLKLTGSLDYRFYGGKWDWLLKKYGNRITTENLDSSYYAFKESTIETIPFALNYDSTSTNVTLHGLFHSCKNLKDAPVINNAVPYGMRYMFNDCRNLRSADNVNIIDGSKLSDGIEYLFNGCYSLRSVNSNTMAALSDCSGTYKMSYVFYCCYVLDEIINAPALNKKFTSNQFNSTFFMCSRVKELKFKTNEDGTPLIREWQNQTMSLDSYVGWANGAFNITNYNSGITADKLVSDAASYEALKNDPDWFTTSVEYSRYNHDSAVNTINSLPDCSAYLASSGGTVNTIKFKGASGSATDGGAINTLTSEEIAVATAKGWTVSFV